MMKTFLRLVGACALGASAASYAVDVKPDHPESYVVQRGDTLWDISGKFLSQPWEWPSLWDKNPQIQNPDLIYPGDVLSLVYVDGKPHLQVTRGTGGRTVKYGRGDTVKLSPEIHATPIETPIPAIPLAAIKPFLSGHRVVTPEDVEKAPYVLAGDQSRIVFGVNDSFFARGDWSAPVQRYGIFREGVKFEDPSSGEFLGLGVEDVGSASLEYNEGDVGRFKVVESSKDVRVNDRLLAADERALASTFYPKAPAKPVEGVIMHVFDGVGNVTSFDVVTLNRGEREGLAAGDVLAVMTRGETVKDQHTQEMIKLPDHRRGMLMVFRTFEKVSYALILRATSPLAIGDRVVNPE